MRIRRTLSLVLPPFLWVGVIFTLSSVPDLQSGLRPVWDLVLRKIAHAAEFGILAALLARLGLHEYHAKSRPFVFWSALLATIFFAVSDEFHQTLIEGRSGAAPDVLIDSLGGLLGLLLYFRFVTTTPAVAGQGRPKADGVTPSPARRALRRPAGRSSPSRRATSGQGRSSPSSRAQ